MRILCKKCKREIEISPFESKDPEKYYRCEFCRVAFTVRPKIGTEGYDIIFKDERFVLRNCVNCGREFYEDPHEAIPVCPKCRTEPHAKPGPGPNQYFILKEQGKKAGPYGLEQLGDWIREGLLDENDAVETPEETKLKVFQVPELSKYLKDFSKIRKKEPASTKPFYRKKIAVFPITAVFTAVIVALWSYLVFQKGPDRPDTTSIDLVYDSWSSVYPSLPLTFDSYYERGMNAYKEYTPSSCMDAKRLFMQSFLKKKEPFLLSFVSFALSCINEFEPDGKLQALAYEMAKYAYDGGCRRPVCHLSLGESLFKQGKIDEALNHFEEAFKTDPQNPAVLSAYGRTLLRDKDKEAKGIEMLEKSLRLDPGISHPHQTLAENYLEKERFKEALFHFEERIKKAPEDYRALIGRASLCVKLKRYNSAISDLTNASRLKKPGGERVLLAKLLYKIHGRTSEAVRNLNLAKANLGKQDMVDSYILLSNIHLEDGRSDEARTEIEKGLALKPTDNFLLLNKIREAIGKRKVEAEQLIQNLLLENKEFDDDTMLNLIDNLSKNSLKDEEFELLQKYAQKPRRFYPFLRLATIYVQRDEIQTAKKVVTDGIEKTVFYADNDFLPALNSPKPEADIGKIEKEFRAKVSSKMNPDLVSAALALSNLQKIKNPTPSNTLPVRRELEGVVKRDPNIKQAHMILGFIYMKTGNAGKAIERLKKAYDMDINDPSTNLLMAMCYAMIGERDKANAKLKGYRENNWNFIALSVKGDMEAMGDRQGAAQFYRQAYSEEERYYPAVLKLIESGG